MVLDGVYAGPSHSPGPFLPLPPPETEDVARVMAGTARRVIRLLEKRGIEGDDDPLAEDDPLLAMLMVASVRSRIATGPEAGLPWRRLGDRVEAEEPDEGALEADAQPPARCVREGGMSLHADVSVPGRDRKRLERLARYVLRSPVTLDRLEALPDGRLAYRLKTPWRDRTTHVLMERHELLERLAPYSEAVASSSLRRGPTKSDSTASWRPAPAEGTVWCPGRGGGWRSVGGPRGKPASYVRDRPHSDVSDA